jgi:hypothetical protein
VTAARSAAVVAHAPDRFSALEIVDESNVLKNTRWGLSLFLFFQEDVGYRTETAKDQ